jgi:hypothetical protein
MEKTKLSLDNFLEEEKSASSDLLVIIESDEQNKNNVTISPWNKSGCSCSGKFSIPKNLIESVEKTKDTHYCCGGTHTVVKVNFAKGASIEIGDLLGQLVKNNKPGSNLMKRTWEAPFDWDNATPTLPLCRKAEIRRMRCFQGRDSKLCANMQIYRNRITGEKCGAIQIGECYEGECGYDGWPA